MRWLHCSKQCILEDWQFAIRCVPFVQLSMISLYTLFIKTTAKEYHVLGFSWVCFIRYNLAIWSETSETPSSDKFMNVSEAEDTLLSEYVFSGGIFSSCKLWSYTIV